MKEKKLFFPMGATYAPLAKATEVDISEWPDDLRRFKELGLNTFRLFICWDRVEQRRGVRDFSRIDRAFELAEQNGLKVIVNMGGTFDNLQAIYPPRWLWYDLHCTLRKISPHDPDVVESNRFKLCYDDPVYQREAKNFIQEAVERYRNHPSLIAWSGWNEPRIAECFCKHTLALFREFLKEKYGDLETLGKAWSTEFPVYFRSWDDVFPQPKAGFEFGGYIPFQDWVEFREKNRTDKFNLIREWIKEIDAATPVISHLCGPHYADIFGKEDILGTSVYTIHAQGKGEDWDPYEFTIRQNLRILPEGRRADRKDPNGFWIVETEAGPVTWVHNLVPRSYSPRKHNARDVLFIAHGARAILRWLYRSRISDAQAGEFNLVGWDGSITERAKEFGKLSEFLNRHTELFLSHEPENPGVYLWDSKDCNSIAEAEGYGWRYCDTGHYLYNALHESGFYAELCNTRQLKEGILKKAKVLIVPFRPNVDPETADLLRAFVEKGGILLAESPFATKDMRGIHYEVTPGRMTDVFGAQVYDMEKLEDGDCGGIPAYDFRAKIRVTDGEVEARFANGDPAIVSHRFGAGLAVLYGSVLGTAYTPETGEVLRNELSKRLAGVNIIPAWKIEKLEIAERKHIQIHPRRLPDGRRLLFVINMDDVPHSFDLNVSGVETAEELGNSDSSNRNTFDGKFHISLGEWGWSVWVC